MIFFFLSLFFFFKKIWKRQTYRFFIKDLYEKDTLKVTFYVGIIDVFYFIDLLSLLRDCVFY